MVSWESPQLVDYELVHSLLETFFVSRIQKEEGVEEVRAHMAGHNIMARDIVAKNNPDSKFNSFKVSVNVVDAEKFNNPDVWPFGVCVRKWSSFDKQT